MAKKDSRDDSLERARRRLVTAQAALQQAQATRADVKAQGEQSVEQARQRAAHRLIKATQRVEQRTCDVQKARRKLTDLERVQTESVPERVLRGGDGETHPSPAETAPVSTPR